MAEITLKSGEIRQVEMEMLPEVNEVKRFFRVFFRRKVVVFGTVVIVLTVLIAIFADLIAPYGSNEQDLTAVLQSPGPAHLLGTDTLGRDLLSRVIFGSRVALIVGVGTVIIAAALGTVIGLIAGYLGGKTQTVIMRIIDAVMALPPTLLALMITVVLGTGVKSVMLAISIALTPGYVRLVCGQVMSVKQNDYIMAEKSMGGTKRRIMFRHILPNCVSPLIVQMTMLMGLAILTEATLSFLNMGIVPPTPAWGSLCYDGYKYLMIQPLLSIIPGLAIMVLVFSFNMVGDGLRDALDPKLRGSV